MSALFGIITAVSIGFGDLVLVGAMRRLHIVTVTAMSMVGAALTAAFGLLLLGGDPIVRDLALGSAAGVLMGVGLYLYFRGLAVSSVGICAPLVAVQVAAFPLVYDVVDGARPPFLVWVGLVVAMVSLIATTISPELGRNVVSGFRFGAAAGACYGLGSLFIGVTSVESGMWPVVANRTTSFVVMTAVAIVISVPLVPAPGDRKAVAAGGLLGGIALLSFAWGTQRHDLAIVGVTGSMFPAVSAYLLYRFLGHPLRWWQGVGIAGVLTGTTLITLG